MLPSSSYLTVGILQFYYYYFTHVVRCVYSFQKLALSQTYFQRITFLFPLIWLWTKFCLDGGEIYFVWQPENYWHISITLYGLQEKFQEPQLWKLLLCYSSYLVFPFFKPALYVEGICTQKLVLPNVQMKCFCFLMGRSASMYNLNYLY